MNSKFILGPEGAHLNISGVSGLASKTSYAMFPNPQKNECRLADALKHISNNQVCVIDVAKLPEDKQAFVFGDAVRTIYNLKLGEYDGEQGVNPPSRIVIFIDELNKYASKDTPKSSPILRELLDVTERGRSLGVVLFGAEQFRSNIHQRVTGNCSTHAYGRTNSIETSTKDYSSLPSTYKNMLTRLEQGDYLIQNPVFRSLLKIKSDYNLRGYFKKLIKIYDELTEGISEDEQGEFYRIREEKGLLYPETATKEAVLKIPQMNYITE